MHPTALGQRAEGRVRMKKTIATVGVLTLAASIVGGAHAHPIADGRLTAGASAIVTFGQSHGCEGADTVRVRIAIPEAVTSVRGLPSAWGEGTFERDATERIVAVTFEKATA